MTTMLDWARHYLALGYRPIPCRPRTKVPMVEWKRYQREAPLLDEVVEWWTEAPDANVALVLGHGCFAVDLDGGEAAEALLHAAEIHLPDDAPRSRTGSGGYHVILAGLCGDRVALFSTDGHKPQVDIRGVGIIVAPPSIHPNGQPYAWQIPLRPVVELPASPGRLSARISMREPDEAKASAGGTPTLGESWVVAALRGVGQGQRNDTCARLAGYYLGKHLDRETTIATLMSGYATRCVPPLAEREVRTVVESVARREASTSEVAQPVTVQHIAQVLADLEAMRRAGPLPVVPTGFSALDYYLNGGFAPGELIYLGARPGVGKTALGLQIAYAAARAEHPVLVISREMVNTALARRLISQVSRIPASDLKHTDRLARNIHHYEAVVQQLGALPIWMTDELVKLADLVALLGALPWASGRTPLVIVDYLQLVRAPADIKERRLQVEAVSQTLKTLALQYKLPLLCLSSLSRPPQASPDTPPTLASLRESGELEHDADVVLFIHRKFQEPDAKLIIAKNREGHLGVQDVRFDQTTLTFSVVEQERN